MTEDGLHYLMLLKKEIKNNERLTTCIINCFGVYVPIGKFSEFSSGSFPFAIFNPNATNHTQTRWQLYQQTNITYNKLYFL